MSKSTALGVMRIALQQYGITEHPAGSNRNKYGKAFGMDGEPWCAEYVWYCGDKATGDNPIYKSANAAGIEDMTVKHKGGKYILKKTSSNAKKKAALPGYRFGDQISFNFHGGSSRDHTGLIVGVHGSTIYCMEGNTSFNDRGSQSNGGCVALRERSYTTGVCIVRPDYAPFKWHVPTKAYTGKIPALPKDGSFDYKDKGSAVKVLQEALAWANGYDLEPDGDFGRLTFAEVVIFQVSQGLVPDGSFGKASLEELVKLINKYKDKASTKNTAKVATVVTKAAAAKASASPLKPKAKKLNDCAIADAYKYKASKSKYKYPGGKPKKHYKEDLNRVFPNRKKWWKQTRAGAACDVYVPVVIRATGADKKMPHGLEYMIPYLEKSKKFKRVKSKKSSKGRYLSPGMLRGGDFVVLKYKGSGAHTFFIVEKGGKKYVAEANYHGKCYPHISKLFKRMYKKNYKMLRVYRAVE